MTHKHYNTKTKNIYKGGKTKDTKKLVMKDPDKHNDK